MRKLYLPKLNKNSQNGFTITDLAIAIVLIMIFTGVIGTVIYQISQVKAETKITAQANIYAIQILEDIDRISYDSVKNGMEQGYKTKFNIPDIFNININISNYITSTMTQDLIKKVEFKIQYTFKGRTETLVINRIKVKEI